MEPRLDKEGRPVRALGLCSGGLDSLLSLAVLREQGIEVTALTFVSPFLSDANAKRGCAALGVPHISYDFTAEHIAVVKNPKHGYGSNMNPCIDCHTLMIRLAGEMMQRDGYHFVFTGEVLGQRPMSQNRGSLNLVAKESGVADYLLRPLSAKRLKTTIPEAEGWVDRERLYNFGGRGRKDQMALAEKLGVTEYPAPAGGCLLTDPGFSLRLRHLLDERPQAGAREMELLRWGRHFDLGEGKRLIVGRKKAENEALKARLGPDDVSLKWTGGPGPLGVVPGWDETGPSPEQIRLAASMLLAYTKARGDTALVDVRTNGRRSVIQAPIATKADFQAAMIFY